MDAKPFGVARCTHKNQYKNEGRMLVSFKVGNSSTIGSIILEMDAETAAEFQLTQEYIISFQKVVHSDGPAQ